LDFEDSFWWFVLTEDLPRFINKLNKASNFQENLVYIQSSPAFQSLIARASIVLIGQQPETPRIHLTYFTAPPFAFITFNPTFSFLQIDIN
jgi:hypothetical protein